MEGKKEAFVGKNRRSYSGANGKRHGIRDMEGFNIALLAKQG